MNGLNYVAFLVLRRLRAPLILLIVVYSINILGYVLIPGQDPDGNVHHLSFFDAFYFVSFMGSTIGFGEVPYEFTYAQRFWTVGAMYSTVISWLYSVGAVFAIFRDDAFLRLVKRTRFKYTVRAMKEPFYIVCGYGLTGSMVVSRLVARGVHCVVIDIDPERMEALELDTLSLDVPSLCADAKEPEALNDAGIEHPSCVGVLCLTNVDHVNLSVAIASKLLKPQRPVISRTETQDYARNLKSFGTDHVMYPFDIFAEYLNMTIHNPYRHLVHDWLISSSKGPGVSAKKPKKGTWIICGYGRFGRSVKQYFDLLDDVTTVIIEPDPSHYKDLGDDEVVVSGLGTEARTLIEAGIETAVGVIAGTADDANNLSIIMTARDLNSKLVTVARQNNRSNASVFNAANIDMVMDPSSITANHMLALIKTSKLIEFLDEIRGQDEALCEQLLQDLEKVVGDRELDSWAMSINQQTAPAMYEQLIHGKDVPISSLYKHPLNRDNPLRCKALMVTRNNKHILVPDDTFKLKNEDQVLLCGVRGSAYWIYWILENDDVLRYILKGSQEVSGSLWRRLKKAS